MSRLLTILFGLFTAVNLFAQQPERIKLVSNRSSLHSEIYIQAKDGKVALSDVFCAVSRYNGYNDKEIASAIPRGRIAIQGPASRWTMAALNRILKPCVSVSATEDRLRITIDRQSSRRWINQRKAEVRQAWRYFDCRDEFPSYGVEFLEEISSSHQSDIVVLVHGLNSRPEDLAGFVPLVKRAGLAGATFRYPNDQPIDESARLLADELTKLRGRYPERKVRLLAHSMGGLVAREAIESEIDPGNVAELIMVGTPNHGSLLARVASFMDCYEFCTSAHYRRASVLVESVSDGLGEATVDLIPNSVFLDRLNQRPRNPRVRYSILLGTGGPMERAEMEQIRDLVENYTSANRLTRFATSKLNRALAELDEVVHGKGDGVVACKRGRLEGVDDILELPFSHAGVLSPRSNPSRAAHAEILRRLKIPTS